MRKEAMKKILFPFVLCASLAVAQESSPNADYYQTAYKLYGTALRAQLHQIIKDHTVVSYSSLYTHYQSTDNKPNGKVWDMYSDVPGGAPAYEYSHGQKTCGSYSKEGDCYNREHSWPQSWFNSQSTPSSDLFHVYPTDGYVNNRRSNYAFGVVGVASWTSSNGSKVGASFSPGYTGTVFEPINAYKGDFARSAFYMSVRYYGEDGGWSTSSGTNKSDLLPWYSAQLLKWHLSDTVSQKELNRNDAVFGIQHNRNPFIDHPEFAAEIWNTAAAPLVAAVTAPTLQSVVVDFTRYVDSTASVTAANFTLDHGIGSPASVEWGVNSDVSKLKLNVPALEPGTTYALQIKNLKSINAVTMPDTTVTFKTPGIASVRGERTLPAGFVLGQNYPNPFNPSTTIPFSVVTERPLTLTVYDMLGRIAARPAEGVYGAGEHRVTFDASALSGGIYYYRLDSRGESSKRKMLLLK
ncbi:MAG: T9SS type A sorting domain-containing protein [Bacteroidetes bacterium]|nr:MAG: T9SS type A sorting domain-containing protein [Bacteroidota bacterium]